MAEEIAIGETMAGGKLVEGVAESFSESFSLPEARSRSVVQEEATCEGTGEVKEVENFAAWADMLPEALAAIFSRLLFEELLNVVPQVCKSWRKAALDPACWQVGSSKTKVIYCFLAGVLSPSPHPWLSCQ